MKTIKILFMFIVLVVFLDSYQVFGAIPGAERQALIDLYNATRGNDWHDHSGWKNPPLHTDGFALPGTENSWAGINVMGDHVTEIELYDNNLIGTIPSSLGNLSQLEILGLRMNKLGGGIPAQLGNLSRCRKFMLDDNLLSGSIPVSLGNLTKLEVLLLQKNNLSGSIPYQLGNLSQLLSICLSNNQLTGNIPSQLGNLKKLQYFNLSYNRLSGEVPTPIKNLILCDTFDIRFNCGFTAKDPEVRAFLNMKNPGWDTQQNHCNLPAISVISPNGGERWEVGSSHPITWNSYNVTGNVRIDYTIDNEASGWTAVTYSTSNTGTFNWTIPDTISSLCKIKITSLSSPSISDVSDNTFIIFKTLSEQDRRLLIELYKSTDGDHWIRNDNWKKPPLHTDGFALPGTENTWFGISIRNNQVYQINLPNNNLNGTLPDCIGSFPGLACLFLQGNSIRGTIPDTWGASNSLQSLYLSRNKLTGTIPMSIGNLTNLLYLDLSNNELTGGVPPTAENLRILRNLVLEHNAFDDILPVFIGNLSELRFLDFAYNKFNGSIPPEWGNLSSLNVMYLENNKLSGKIPETLGNLHKLTILFLSNNQLTGTIPVEIGNLSNLNYLHLENNRLEGPIPASFGNLTKLIGLNLHSNKLEGEIPATFINLVNLSKSMDIGYNALYTNDTQLNCFIEKKNPGWEKTQTVAPGKISVANVTGSSVTLNWDVIPYKSGKGGYEVYLSTVLGGPYTLCGSTKDKTVATMTVTGLNPMANYFFVVKTRTDANWNNSNTVRSAKPKELETVTAPF